MHNQSLLILLLIISCFAFSCKKEKQVNKGTVEFDANGLHHSFAPQSAGLGPGGFGKVMGIQSPSGNFSMQIRIVDDSLANPGIIRSADYFYLTGRYSGFYTDINGCSYDDMVDTNSVSLHVISCGGDPPVLNATFNMFLDDGNPFGNTSCPDSMSITNGKITNVLYSIEN